MSSKNPKDHIDPLLRDVEPFSQGSATGGTALGTENTFVPAIFAAAAAAHLANLSPKDTDGTRTAGQPTVPPATTSAPPQDASTTSTQPAGSVAPPAPPVIYSTNGVRRVDPIVAADTARAVNTTNDKLYGAGESEEEVKRKRAFGENTWVKGTKLELLLRLKKEWVEASAKSGEYVRNFYLATAHYWIMKYGYNFPLHQGSDVPLPDLPKIGLNRTPFIKGVDADTAATCRAYAKDLAHVCSSCSCSSFMLTTLQKIAKWYYYQFNTVSKKEQQEQELALLDMIQPQKKMTIRRLGTGAGYSKFCWDKIKPEYNAILAPALADWTRDKELGLAMKSKASVHMEIQRQVEQRLWDTETPDVKAAITEMIERDYQKRLEEQKRKHEVPHTPKEYNW